MTKATFEAIGLYIIVIGIIGGFIVALAIGAPESVKVTTPPPNVVRVFAEERGGTSNGTGVLIAPNLIVTNHHVIRDGTGKVQVMFPDWTLYDATIVKADKRWDLALLRIDPVLIPPMPLGETPSYGARVTVGGYGPGFYAQSEGPVVKFYQPDKTSPPDLFSVDALVRSGDSGGPVQLRGKLVGVLFGCSDGTYAVAVDRLRKFLEE
ncbi:MAG: hypothetical protein AMS22_08375 [Thiotrichales bacterium SG8_50]|nr:MAG: hypothetical protein AMS22_08375 [Thiotrichales bacterium SG8_50]